MAQALSIQILNTGVKRDGNNKEISLLVTMDCGCPACAGGRWKADRFKVKASIFDSENLVAQINFRFSGRPGEFVATMPKLEKGRYDMIVEALDPETGLAGREATQIIID